MKVKKHEYPMRVICAWCKKLMRISSCYEPDQTSHGICDPCKKIALADFYKLVPGKESINY